MERLPEWARAELQATNDYRWRVWETQVARAREGPGILWSIADDETRRRAREAYSRLAAEYDAAGDFSEESRRRGLERLSRELTEIAESAGESVNIDSHHPPMPDHAFFAHGRVWDCGAEYRRAALD